MTSNTARFELKARIHQTNSANDGTRKLQASSFENSSSPKRLRAGAPHSSKAVCWPDQLGKGTRKDSGIGCHSRALAAADAVQQPSVAIFKGLTEHKQGALRETDSDHAVKRRCELPHVTSDPGVMEGYYVPHPPS